MFSWHWDFASAFFILMPSGDLCMTIYDFTVVSKAAHAHITYIVGGRREDAWQTLLTYVCNLSQMMIL